MGSALGAIESVGIDDVDHGRFVTAGPGRAVLVEPLQKVRSATCSANAATSASSAALDSARTSSDVGLISVGVPPTSEVGQVGPGHRDEVPQSLGQAKESVLGRPARCPSEDLVDRHTGRTQIREPNL